MESKNKNSYISVSQKKIAHLLQTNNKFLTFETNSI